MRVMPVPLPMLLLIIAETKAYRRLRRMQWPCAVCGVEWCTRTCKAKGLGQLPTAALPRRLMPPRFECHHITTTTTRTRRPQFTHADSLLGTREYFL